MSTDPKKAKEAKEIRDKWKNVDLAEYRDFIANRAVHFTFKATNSNAPGGGVRLAKEEKLDLPYVCLQTHGGAVDLEYALSGDMTLLKQILWCDDPELRSEIPDAQSEITQIAKDYRDLSESHIEVNTGYVSPRLRQILLPKEDGSYVSVSPLRSTTFSDVVKQRIVRLNKEAKTQENARRLQTAFMGFGGANPQNSGRFTRSLQSPLLFFSPSEDWQTKQAFSFFHKGVSLHCPPDAMFEYRKWKAHMLKIHPDGIPNTLRIREKEKGFVQRVARAVLRRAGEVRAFLEKSVDRLPAAQDRLFSTELPAVQVGLLDRDERDQPWRDVFAEEIANSIKKFVFKDTGETIGADTTKVQQYQSWVKEVI